MQGTNPDPNALPAREYFKKMNRHERRKKIAIARRLEKKQAQQQHNNNNNDGSHHVDGAKLQLDLLNDPALKAAMLKWPKHNEKRIVIGHGLYL